jgi:predicted HAD superfamily Cof-like phosphohydrolase
MNIQQRLVEEFHDKFGATIGHWPEMRDRELRAKLIMEEAVETVAAMGFLVQAGISDGYTLEPIADFDKERTEPDLVEAIDGLCDLLYVVNGAAVAFGIDLEPFFDEVHRANMAKEGGMTRADGKVLKPEGWKPPDIESILLRQEANGDIWRALHRDALQDEYVEVLGAPEEAVA